MLSGMRWTIMQFFYLHLALTNEFLSSVEGKKKDNKGTMGYSQNYMRPTLYTIRFS